MIELAGFCPFYLVPGVGELLEIEQALLLAIKQVYEFLGWPGVVGLMALESACIPIPSEVIMPLSGWMLVKERGLGASYTLLAGFYGALGCSIGSAVAYWAGAWGGRPLLKKYGKYLLVTSHDLAMADRWFQKYGGSTAFFSRLLPIVRTFISFPAGVARMSLPKFLLYTFLGSFPWCWGLAYAGYLLGEHWEKIRDVMRPFDIPIGLGILLLFALYVYRHIKKARSEPS